MLSTAFVGMLLPQQQTLIELLTFQESNNRSAILQHSCASKNFNFHHRIGVLNSQFPTTGLQTGIRLWQIFADPQEICEFITLSVNVIQVEDLTRCYNKPKMLRVRLPRAAIMAVSPSGLGSFLPCFWYPIC